MFRKGAEYLFEHALSRKPWESDFPAVGKHNFLQLAQVNYLPEQPVLPINHLKSMSDNGRYWYHCFTGDKYFHRLYTHFQEYMELLQRARGLISADFSLYRDLHEEILISNCRANRLVDYALQQAGIPVNDREARRLFVGGVNAMVEKINPTAIVVCGKCPDWLEKRFPEIQIVQRRRLLS